MEKAQDIASSVASTAEEAWESARQGVGQAASTVATTASDSWDEITRFMRRYPMATLCAGVGLGFVLSRLFEDQGIRRFGGRSWGYSPEYGSDYRSNMGGR